VVVLEISLVPLRRRRTGCRISIPIRKVVKGDGILLLNLDIPLALELVLDLGLQRILLIRQADPRPPIPLLQLGGTRCPLMEMGSD
jgi:hypothetical protein